MAQRGGPENRDVETESGRRQVETSAGSSIRIVEAESVIGIVAFRGRHGSEVQGARFGMLAGFVAFDFNQRNGA